MNPDIEFEVGDLVSKTGGDYRFDGTVVAIFKKISGLTRYVVEDDRGVLHIYNRSNIKLSSEGESKAFKRHIDKISGSNSTG